MLGPNQIGFYTRTTQTMWSSQDEGRASSLYQKCEAGKANDAVLSQNLDILPLVLRHACIAVHLDIVRMLLRHDFDLDRIANDETPLFIACSAPRYLESDATRIVDLLLSRGANQLLSSRGVTPLFRAVEKNSLELMRVLLRHGAIVDEVAPAGAPRYSEDDPKYDFLGESNQDTPLDRACAYSLIPLIRFLLANGAAWDRVTRIGVTLVSYVRSRRNRSGGRELNQIFDEFFTKYWMLRLRLRVVGRRSVAQQRVLGDLYLSNHLASFVIGDGVLSGRPAS